MAANPTWAASAASRADPTRPWPDWPRGDDAAVADLDEPRWLARDPPAVQQGREVVEVVGRRVVVLGRAHMEREPLAPLDAARGDPGDGGDGGLDAHGSDRCYRLARLVPSIPPSAVS
jgi:hypothetical protein